ncbi:hypothetical protein GBA52_004840 [Prunus armeniaca]|nr:hypothetical protein GBA52_004840 [Prunus armeniaca]
MGQNQEKQGERANQNKQRGKGKGKRKAIPKVAKEPPRRVTGKPPVATQKRRRWRRR